MRNRLLLLLLLLVPLAAAGQDRQYYPGRFDWQSRRPQDTGMDGARLDAAIKFAAAAYNSGEGGATKGLREHGDDGKRAESIESRKVGEVRPHRQGT